MTTLLAAILGPLITLYFGNKALSKWQFRTWLHQHEVQKATNKLEDIKQVKLVLGSAMFGRIFAMQSIAMNAPVADKPFIDRLRSEYSEKRKNWNENLMFLLAQLTSLGCESTASIIEHEIQLDFREANNYIDIILDNLDQGIEPEEKALKESQKILRKINGKSSELFLQIDDKCKEIEKKSEGFSRIYAKESSLGLLSNYELLKLAWTRDIERFSVLRTSLDTLEP